MRLKTKIAAVVAVASCSFLVAPAGAMADTTPATPLVDHLEIQTDGVVDTTLVLNFDSPETVSNVKQELAEAGYESEGLTVDPSGDASLTDDSDSATGSSGPVDLRAPGAPAQPTGARKLLASGPKAAYHYCNETYAYTDVDGRVSWTRRCGSPRNDWTYNISAQTRSIMTGLVLETGLNWYINSKKKGTNASHQVTPSYQFHGAMQPVGNNQYVSYDDTFKFRHNLGKGGDGALLISGSMTLAPLSRACAQTKGCA